MKLFLGTLGVCCLITASFVFWVDPGALWHNAPQWPSTPLKAGELWIPERSNFDQRLIRFAQIHSLKDVDTVVLGSSRAMKINASQFTPPVRLANLGIILPSVQDYMEFWEALRDEQKTPKQIIIILDTWVFNKNAATRNYANPSYSPVLRDFKLPFYVMNSSGWRRTLGIDAATYWLGQLKECLTMTNLVDSLSILRLKKTGRLSSQVAPADQLTSKEVGYRADGSMVAAAETLTPTVLRGRVRQTIYNARLNPFLNWRPNPLALDEMHQFLNLAHETGTHVLIVLPPYQPMAYQYFMHDPASKSGVEAFEDVAAGLGHSPDVRVCVATDPARIGCSAEEFEDYHHAQASCLQKMINACAGHS